MSDRHDYERWVDAYVAAWNSNDPSAIGELFTPDARYMTEPFAEPWEGREEIVRKWLERKDEPGDTTFTFEVLVAGVRVGIIKGVTEYASTGTRYFNLWEVQLDEEGACLDYVEWWMEHKPIG